jgi:hypothetical protein
VGAILTRALPIAAALAASVAVAGSYAALGGGSYEPTPVADPCTARAWRSPDDLDTVLEQVVLSALDGAACTLGVSREDLVLALRSEDALDGFASEHGVSRADAEAAIRDGLERAVDEAEAADALPESVASIARRAIEALEPWRLIDALEALRFLLPG